MMYTLSVPIMNHSVDESTRQIYLEQCKKAKVDRIFLIPEADFSADLPIGDGELEGLKANISYFRQNGICAQIWVGGTIGHGGHTVPGAQESTPEGEITPLVDLSGNTVTDTHCPLDPLFQRRLALGLSRLATAGADLILIDDDFRLSQHGPDFCCACHRHMAKIGEIFGGPIDRQTLKEKAFIGAPNRYRSAFLRAQGDSLRELATGMRQAVDQVDPKIGLALCSCHCSWDSDGCDPMEITEIFRGEHAPVLRLHGAAYWATRGYKTLPSTVEIARMFAAFCDGKGYELLTENDAYPRPRYHTPASLVELHDAMLRADQGHSGGLKYMFDYTASPLYETGYLDRHCKDYFDLAAIEQAFQGSTQYGVKICCFPHLASVSDYSLSEPGLQSPYPVAGCLLAQHGIPTTYREKGVCSAIFGENIRLCHPSDWENGVILDAVSALLLTEQGVDVGLTSADRNWIHTDISFLEAADRKEKAPVLKNRCKLLLPALQPDAEPMLYGTLSQSSNALLHSAIGKDGLLCYRYENKAGQRFLVYLFDASALEYESGILSGYLQQRMLLKQIPWLARTDWAVYCPGNHPDLSMIAAETEDGLVIGLFNCFADEVTSPVLQLGRCYTKAAYLRCNGALEGNRVTLSYLPPYGFCAVILK